MSFSTIGRSLLVLFSLLMAASPLAAQARGDYRFVADDGTVLLSDVDLQSWYDGHTFTVELYITPTADEIEALRDTRWPSSPDTDDWSHVDLEFTVFDFDVTDAEPQYETDQSGFVRKVDDALVDQNNNPVVRMIGFNLGRWQPGETITVTVKVYGYSPLAYPLFSVDLMSTVYWPDNERCDPMPGLVSNQDEELCGLYGRRAHLDDGDGGRQF